MSGTEGYTKVNMKKAAAILFFLLLTACTSTTKFRGVPQETWSQLSAEQKQLIVDKSYYQELEQE